jgi:hypothetical protein
VVAKKPLRGYSDGCLRSRFTYPQRSAYYVNTNINHGFAVEELGYIRSEGDIKVVAFHSLKPHCLDSPSLKIHVLNINQVME